jgi:hypothetical protein
MVGTAKPVPVEPDETIGSDWDPAGSNLLRRAYMLTTIFLANKNNARGSRGLSLLSKRLKWW